jgi:hypothetical protein
VARFGHYDGRGGASLEEGIRDRISQQQPDPALNIRAEQRHYGFAPSKPDLPGTESQREDSLIYAA